MTVFESLIAEFSEKTGHALAPEADGSVSLEADGVPITVQSRENRGDMVLFSFPAGDMKPDSATMGKALELAAHGEGTDGFHLGISGGVLVLSGTMPLHGTSAENMAAKLLSLAAATTRVGTALSGAQTEYAEAAAEREEFYEDLRNLPIIPV